jgi:transcriptional regulator with XRE-family HTH domain
MKERILEFLRHENKTSSQFAEEIGVQPSSVSHIISGRNKPSLDFVIKMLQQYVDLSTDWLVFGKGDMFKTDSGADLFSNFESASDQEEKTVSNTLSTQTSDNEIAIEAKNNVLDLQRGSKSSIQKVLLIYSDNSFIEYKPG